MTYEQPRQELQDCIDANPDAGILQWAAATLDTMQEAIKALLFTADHVRPVAAMTVYAVSPLNEVETLYVEDCLYYASTCFPAEGMGADTCKFPIIHCYTDKQSAVIIAAMRSAAED